MHASRCGTCHRSVHRFLEKPEAIIAGERLAQSFPGGSADVVAQGTGVAQVDVVIDTALAPTLLERA